MYGVAVFGMMALGLAASAAGCKSEVDPGEVSCDEYVDAAPAAEVTVRFRNDGAAPIYVGSTGGCGDVPPFAIRDEAGVAHPFYLGACAYSCEDLQEHDGVCAADCAIPPVFLVAPGGHYDMTWNGTVLETVEMPDACFASAQGGECQQVVVAADGTYELSGEVFSEATGCDPSGGTEPCTCTPSADGWCQLDYTASVGGAPRTATATLAFPGGSLVEIVFE